MIVEKRLVVGRLRQDRRSILADEADDGRVCEGEVEGHISAEPFAVQANPIIEFSPDVLQNFQMAADELVHCSTAMALPIIQCPHGLLFGDGFIGS